MLPRFKQLLKQHYYKRNENKDNQLPIPRNELILIGFFCGFLLSKKHKQNKPPPSLRPSTKHKYYE